MRNFRNVSFFANSTEYLGHIIDDEGLQSNPRLIQALKDFPQLKILKELQSFLRLMNYYQKFIINFSHIILSFNEYYSE